MTLGYLIPSALVGTFFPATVTRITAGSNCLDSSKNTYGSIPNGTLATTLTTTFMYLISVFLFGCIATREKLYTDRGSGHLLNLQCKCHDDQKIQSTLVLWFQDKVKERVRIPFSANYNNVIIKVNFEWICKWLRGTVLEVKAEDEDENEAATVGTITRAPYPVQPFSGTTYVGSGSSRKVFAPVPIGKDVDILHRKVKSLAQQMFERANTEYSTLKRHSEMDRYLGGIGMKRWSETQKHYELKQSVSTLEDQMRGLILEDKEEKERLKKKLKVSQQEKEQMEKAFRHVVDWIRKQFRVEIPPCMDEGDVTTPDNAHP
nr:cation-chloride cotransporter 1-like isoform X2 [Tanacetum cinerariifolium]